MNREQKLFKAIDRLRKAYPDYYIDTWCPEDFRSMTERNLTKEACVYLVDCMRHRNDCEIGINWEFIRCCLDECELS